MAHHCHLIHTVFGKPERIESRRLRSAANLHGRLIADSWSDDLLMLNHPTATPVRILVIAVSLLLGLAAGAAPAEPLTIQGSSTFSANILIPNQAKIETISGQAIKIVGIRTDVGLLRLLAHQAEFAIISTSLSHAIDSLRSSRPDLPYRDLVAFPVSQVRVAFAVNPSNPVRMTDIKMLRQVLAGEVTNWKQLGGPNLPIRVVYVEGGGGVTLAVAGELFGTRSFTPANPIRVTYGSQVIKVVEQEPRALGVAQLGLVKEHQLPELATEHVIEQELSLVTLGEPKPAQRAVISAVRQVAASAAQPIR
jgi:phosphate transport system substrate-binding protein